VLKERFFFSFFSLFSLSFGARVQADETEIFRFASTDGVCIISLASYRKDELIWMTGT